MRGRGFSVIEVMIAAGVLAVVVALVMPAALGRLGSRSLDQTGQDLAAALTLAQGEAGETGLGVAIRLRPDDAGAWHAESAVIAHAEEVESFDALAGDSSASRQRPACDPAPMNSTGESCLRSRVASSSRSIRLNRWDRRRS